MRPHASAVAGVAPLSLSFYFRQLFVAQHYAAMNNAGKEAFGYDSASPSHAGFRTFVLAAVIAYATTSLSPADHVLLSTKFTGTKSPFVSARIHEPARPAAGLHLAAAPSSTRLSPEIFP
jgi:hypothetical protein